MQKFPRIQDLARASNAEILIAWRGLGYNRRALRLRDTAKVVMARGGDFPREIAVLQSLPGIGHYTAGAIRNFAFGIPTPCIDVNIRRIIHRFFIGPESRDGTWKKTDRELLPLLHKILCVALQDGKRTSADFFAALMDFGSAVCTKYHPQWHMFSEDLQSCCKSYGKEIVRTKKVNKIEPGRVIAGRFVPNRIIRGRIVEILRDQSNGMTLESIGRSVAIDWTMGDFRSWLLFILHSLKADHMVSSRKHRYYLA